MYWFTRLYFSPNPRSSLNIFRRCSSSAPAFMSFFCCLTQFLRPRSESTYLEGFRLFTSMKLFTSLYLVNQRSSCVIPYFNISSSPIGSYLPSFTSRITVPLSNAFTVCHCPAGMFKATVCPLGVNTIDSVHIRSKSS